MILGRDPAAHRSGAAYVSPADLRSVCMTHTGGLPTLRLFKSEQPPPAGSPRLAQVASAATHPGVIANQHFGVDFSPRPGMKDSSSIGWIGMAQRRSLAETRDRHASRAPRGAASLRRSGVPGFGWHSRRIVRYARALSRLRSGRPGQQRVLHPAGRCEAIGPVAKGQGGDRRHARPG